jgi:fucose permease
MYGATFTVIGASLPQIIRGFRWSYTITGLVVSASAIGYILSTFVCGFLVQKFPPKAVLLAGLAVGAVSLQFFVRWPSPSLNFLLNLAIGFCQGTMEVVTNLEVIHMEQKGKSRLMNLMHAAFSMGAIAGPAVVGWLLGGGSTGYAVFPATGALLALMLVLFGLTRFPRLDQTDEGGEKGGIRLLRQPIILILTFLLFLYVGGELGISTWLSEYFVKVLGAPPSLGALSVSILWVGILAGRLAVSLGYHGFRQERIILGLAVLVTAAVGLLLLLRSIAAVAGIVFLVGVGYSAIYPLGMTVVGRYYKSGVAVGVVATGGGVGSFIFPFAMAALSDAVGLRGGFLFTLLVNGALAAFALGLMGAVRSRGRSEGRMERA